MPNIKTAVLFALSLFVCISTYAQRYTDTIPPEILRQYDPAIVSGDRPHIVAITKAMIWGLRENPDQGGDIYRFNFDRSSLSSTQIEILRAWVKTGVDILFWSYNTASEYSSIFGDEITLTSRKSCGGSRSNHPVNTDVTSVVFSWSGYTCGIFTHYPLDTEVIVSNRDGVVAGRIPYGSGNIYFSLHAVTRPSGRDRDRWTLNFYQWMLGKKVPGSAETDIGITRRDDANATAEFELEGTWSFKMFGQYEASVSDSRLDSNIDITSNAETTDVEEVLFTFYHDGRGYYLSGGERVSYLWERDYLRSIGEAGYIITLIEDEETIGLRFCQLSEYLHILFFSTNYLGSKTSEEIYFMIGEKR